MSLRPSERTDARKSSYKVALDAGEARRRREIRRYFGTPWWQGQQPRKPQRWRSGTLTLREIRKFQKSTSLLIPFAPFVRLVRKVTFYSTEEVNRWTPEALLALQEAAEFHLIEVFQTANLFAIYAKRVTLRGLESTPKASFKGRVKRKRITTKASNQMSVPKENIRSLVPKASLKGRAKHKRTTTKASNQILVPKENIGVLVPSDVICGEIEKEPTSPLVEQNSGYKVLLGTPVSRMIKTPFSYVHQSLLTRCKAKALSISTPESMKRSRSGRLIVPRLDPGSQNIIYGPDGDIYGIKNMEVQSPQEINLEPPSKRRKRSRLLSPDYQSNHI